jgi:hypothetical protein
MCYLCIRWAQHVAHKGEMKNVYKTFVRKPNRKRPLARPRHTWDDNIKMDF